MKVIASVTALLIPIAIASALVAGIATPKANACLAKNVLHSITLGYTSPCGECKTKKGISGVWDWTATGQKYYHGCD